MPTATKVKLRPLHDRILVKRLEETEERHGSIIIPDTAKEKPGGQGRCRRRRQGDRRR